MSPCILLIDDDQISNHLTQATLKGSGINHIQVVNNGKEGLDYIQSALRWNKPLPTHILLDIKMPVMDGFEFLKQYRSLGFENSGIKVILFTSSINPKGFDFLKEFGFNEIVIKPLTQDKINSLLTQSLAQN
ncbi:MAG: response regulator [Cytophagaceae bacterium]|nr:response regulator [Cytophagaceae bacterium]